jgi:hypothetical protein
MRLGGMRNAGQFGAVVFVYHCIVRAVTFRDPLAVDEIG